MSTPGSSAPPSCTVYFDGGCPVCTAEISWYRDRAGESVSFVDVNAVTTPAQDLTREEALARFHMRLPDGSLVSGARAFIALWATIPSLKWAARLASVPPLPHGLELGYRTFLRLRPFWRKP